MLEGSDGDSSGSTTGSGPSSYPPQQRREQILAKKAKLAELRRQHESREQESGNWQSSCEKSPKDVRQGYQIHDRVSSDRDDGNAQVLEHGDTANEVAQKQSAQDIDSSLNSFLDDLCDKKDLELDNLFSNPAPTSTRTVEALTRVAEVFARYRSLQEAIDNHPELNLLWKIMSQKAQHRETVRRLMEESKRLQGNSEPADIPSREGEHPLKIEYNEPVEVVSREDGRSLREDDEAPRLREAKEQESTDLPIPARQPSDPTLPISNASQKEKATIIDYSTADVSWVLDMAERIRKGTATLDDIRAIKSGEFPVRPLVVRKKQTPESQEQKVPLPDERQDSGWGRGKLEDPFVNSPSPGSRRDELGMTVRQGKLPVGKQLPVESSEFIALPDPGAVPPASYSLPKPPAAPAKSRRTLDREALPPRLHGSPLSRPSEMAATELTAGKDDARNVSGNTAVTGRDQIHRTLATMEDTVTRMNRNFGEGRRQNPLTKRLGSTRRQLLPSEVAEQRTLEYWAAKAFENPTELKAKQRAGNQPVDSGNVERLRSRFETVKMSQEEDDK
ncbi:hypothetical protein EK21DRAFT_106319 [Setomelanomma holmii]|uniref:Uncharacterized protein n=1 Tax=Setomelanomma holmii TaxID=210430 RepID=A0A9P4HL17_9PLEO|nr:hypothetical protein EK21DRAFT_106319 [Setomelanomma holmii]